MLKKKYRKSILYAIAIVFSLAISSCKSYSPAVRDADTVTTPDLIPPPPPTPPPTPTPTPVKNKDSTSIIVTDDMLKLEAKYPNLLAPILSLKKSKPKTYWFIVSWLNTNYKTPDWKNYNSDTWQKEAKIKGIDCSGFVRVMHDKVFGYKVMGPSRYLLSNYSKKITLSKAKMGDLVFFKAPNSQNNRIIHIGVYLMDNYFVHATSTKSAAEGFGLNVTSLEKKRWKDNLVAVGRIKDEFSTKE